MHMSSPTLHIRLTKELTQVVDKLISEGHYSSQADAIRQALRELLEEYA